MMFGKEWMQDIEIYTSLYKKKYNKSKVSDGQLLLNTKLCIHEVFCAADRIIEKITL